MKNSKEKEAIIKIRELMEGDIFPQYYWNALKIKKYPKFPNRYHNALVDFVISVWAEIGTIINEELKEKQLKEVKKKRGSL